MVGFETISEKARYKKWLPILAITGAIGVACAISYSIHGIVKSFNAFASQWKGEQEQSINYMVFIIIAIALSIIMLLIYRALSKKSSLQEASVKFADLAILIAGMLVADALRTDYSAFGILTIAVTYGLRRNHFKAILWGCITLTIMSISEATAFLGLIPAYFYNGKRGMKMKIVFYAFYPVHLLVLYLICYYMNLV